MLVGATLLMLSMTQDSSYHGYARHDFTCAGLKAILVEPKHAVPGRPWIWRMEFFDHRPELDLMLLERGYHLAHIAVGNTFGGPMATWELSQLYNEVTGDKWRLNRRVVLEGFSRGGLYAYNWAALNPDRIQAIYGDAPLCDVAAWPHERSPQDWADLMKSYGFPSDAKALAYPFWPINRLDGLAKAKIPIVHVVGDADDVVPVALNTSVIEERYRQLGGTIHVIHKPGVGHHPHSLDDPSPIATFLAAHAEDSLHAPASTTIPSPGIETRSESVGWQGRSWLDQHQDTLRAGREHPFELVMLGDSLTQAMGGEGRHLDAQGVEPAKRLGSFLNAGVNSDRVQNVLWRLQHGLLDVSAKRFVILIGINNAPDDSPESVTLGIQLLVDTVRTTHPEARVDVLGLLPAGKHPSAPQRVWCDKVNALLSKHLHYGHYIAPSPHFLSASGDQTEGLFNGDGVHLTAAGYEVLVEEILSK